MEFSYQHCISILERTPVSLEKLLFGLDTDLIHANEGDKTWSPYDVMGHLIHGEKTDWIPRMLIVLGDKEDKNFTPFDRFAQEKESDGKTMGDLLHEFKTLRKHNLRILEGFEVAEHQLDREGIHPDFGPVTLRNLFATWAVHDLNHIAQIARVMAHQNRENVGPWEAYLRILKY